MHITLSAFFSGTGHSISEEGVLAGLLSQSIDEGPAQKMMGFDGCGEVYGFRGNIFGAGLDEQCDQLIHQVETEIQKGNTVTLNVYGHSRGAIGAQMLAKQLSDVDQQLLQINLALLDPVPGNFITTSTVDPLNISLAQKTMDLRECNPLRNALVLYPHQPLPSILCHAPLLSLYPQDTRVVEEVIAGCHSGAQFLEMNADRGAVFNLYSFIAFVQVFEFLKACGSDFKPFPSSQVWIESNDGLYLKQISMDALKPALLQVYNELLTREAYQDKDRDCHSATGAYIHTKAKAAYFNLDHQRLAGVLEDKRTVHVSFEEGQGPISRLKRVSLHYPIATQWLKWTVISIGVMTGFVLSTGGLSAMALLMGLTTKLGMMSCLVATPVVGGIVAGLWYGAMKPVLHWAVNRIVYPKFYMRQFHPHPQERSIPSSHGVIASDLGVAQRPEPQNGIAAPSCQSLFLGPQAARSLVNRDLSLSGSSDEVIRTRPASLLPSPTI